MDFPFISNKPGFEGAYPVNLMLDPERNNGRPALVGTPGAAEWISPRNGPVRALKVFHDNLFAVIGQDIFRINQEGTVRRIGELATETGRLAIEGDNRYLIFSDGKNCLGYTGRRMSQVSTPENFTTMTYQDGRLIGASGTDFYYYSESFDGIRWSAINSGNKWRALGGITAVKSFNGDLWIFGSENKEVHYNSGGADNLFLRRNGAEGTFGISAPHTLVETDNTLFWLNDEKKVSMSSGYGHIVISPPELNSKFFSFNKVDDAFGFILRWGNHVLYVLTFPTEDQTWVYDLSVSTPASPTWFQWSTGLNKGRYRATSYAYFSGRHLIGDESGAILELSDDEYLDYNELIYWERQCSPVHADRKKIFVSTFELEHDEGHGKIIAVGSTVPQDSSSQGDYTINVSDITGVKKGYILHIELDDGTIQECRVTKNPSGNTLSLNEALDDDVGIIKMTLGEDLEGVTLTVADASGWKVGDYVCNDNLGGGTDGDDWTGVIRRVTGTTSLIIGLPSGTDIGDIDIADGIRNETRNDVTTISAKSGWQVGQAVWNFTLDGASLGADWRGVITTMERNVITVTMTTGDYGDINIDDGIYNNDLDEYTTIQIATVSNKINFYEDRGEDPEASLDISYDRGKTWLRHSTVSMGKAGEHNNRTRWSRLGAGRDVTLRVYGTSPAKRVFYGANINAEVGI